MNRDAFNRRVLIVDDSEHIHEDFHRILRGQGARAAFELADLERTLFGEQDPNEGHIEFQIDDALQGEDALRLVREASGQGSPYAMAFVDMRMPPGWDGVVTIENIWRADPELEIVICTAYSDYSWEESLKRLGQPDRLLILKKPFDPIEVQQLAMSLTQKWNLGRLANLRMLGLEGEIEDHSTALAKVEALHERTLDTCKSLSRTIDGILLTGESLILVVDAQGKMSCTSRAVGERLGLSQSQLVGRDMHAVLRCDGAEGCCPLCRGLAGDDDLFEQKCEIRDSACNENVSVFKVCVMRAASSNVSGLVITLTEV